MLRTLIHIFIAVLICCGSQTALAGRYACYFLINMYSCNNCNRIAMQLNNYPDLGRNGAFLFSSDDVTEEQALDYLGELFDKQKKVVVNKKTYDILIHAMKDEYKIPHVAVFDSLSQKPVLITSFDSLDHYRSIFNYYLSQDRPYRTRTIYNSRISKLIGLKSLAKVNNILFVSAYQNGSKLYLYDLTSNKLDSIALSDATLKKLYEAGGKPNVDVARIRAYQKLKNLPMPMFQFGDNPVTDGENYYTYLDLFYHDPDHKGDTISPEWIPFLVSYNPATKQLKINRYKSWWYPKGIPGSPDQPAAKYWQDLNYKQPYGDSLWIIAVEKLADPGEMSKTMMLARFVRDTVNKEWIYNGFADSIYYDNIHTFKGETLNARFTYYPYQYKPPYFFYSQSPLIKNTQTGQVLDISKTDSTTDWIHEVKQQGSLLEVVAQSRRNRIYLYTFNAADLSLKSKETIIDKTPAHEELAADGGPKALIQYKSNLVLDKERIYFINKLGESEIHSKD